MCGHSFPTGGGGETLCEALDPEAVLRGPLTVLRPPHLTSRKSLSPTRFRTR